MTDYERGYAAALAEVRAKVKDLPWFDPADRVTAMNGTVREPRTMADAVEAYRARTLALLDAPAPSEPEGEQR